MVPTISRHSTSRLASQPPVISRGDRSPPDIASSLACALLGRGLSRRGPSWTKTKRFSPPGPATAPAISRRRHLTKDNNPISHMPTPKGRDLLRPALATPQPFRVTTLHRCSPTLPLSRSSTTKGICQIHDDSSHACDARLDVQSTPPSCHRVLASQPQPLTVTALSPCLSRPHGCLVWLRLHTQPHTQPLLRLLATQGLVLHAHCRTCSPHSTERSHHVYHLDRVLTPQPPTQVGYSHVIMWYMCECYPSTSPHADPTAVSCCVGSPHTHSVRMRSS